MMMSKSVKPTVRDKGDRKGWATIQDSKKVRLSDAKNIIVYNPLTGQNKNIKLSNVNGW